MLRRRRSVAPRTNACVKENAHPESDKTSADDTNFRKVNTMKMVRLCLYCLRFVAGL